MGGSSWEGLEGEINEKVRQYRREGKTVRRPTKHNLVVFDRPSKKGR